MSVRQMTTRSKNVMVWFRILVLALILLIVTGQVWIFAAPGSVVEADNSINSSGIISVGTANVRPAPNTSGSPVDTLYNGHLVYVLESVTGQFVSNFGDTWYKINFIGRDGQFKEGYTVAGFVTLYETNPEFEAMLEAEQFPESYRPGLRALHALYPQWQFKALHTNHKWQDAVSAQYRAGVSLIQNSANDAWKSYDSAAYDWTTNTWKIFDGTSWVMCSREVIEYYMDPRNMLGPVRIFMFENLQYNPQLHTREGVARILSGTPMAPGNSFTYPHTDTSGNTTSRTIEFVDAYMEAAQEAQVSAYHIASRSAQEVGSNPSNPLISGTFPDPYTGLYNYYGIGAYATPGFTVAENGLQYAKYGPRRRPVDSSFTQAQLDRIAELRIPWDNRYKAILGGAIFIGTSYINVKQHTIYLQRFNLISDVYNPFTHQYMTNIGAAVSESSKLANAYSSQNATNSNIEFLIPVYQEMPAAPAPLPPADGNRNNWLKDVRIDGLRVTPTFDPAVRTGYSYVVEESVATVRLTATPVTNKSAVNNAPAGQFARDYNLQYGDNLIKLVVAAENGSKRTYEINVYRNPPPPTAITSDVYQINLDRGMITGFDPTKDLHRLESFRVNLNIPENHEVRIYDKDGNPDPALMGTGTRVDVVYLNNETPAESGTNPTAGETSTTEGEMNTTEEIIESYTVVMFGDVDGNGRINSADLNAILNHVLRRESLSDINLFAADSDQNNRVNSADLNHILNHILRRTIIDQKYVEGK